MPYCSVIGCSNKAHQGSGISFHRFPSKGDPRRQEWIRNISRHNFVPTTYSTVCSKHFKAEHFDRTGQTIRLRDTAVPTENMLLQTGTDARIRAPIGQHAACCAALGCSNTQTLGFQLTTFPAGKKDLQRCKKWIHNMQRARIVPEVEYAKLTEQEKAGLTSTKNLKLCEDHFEASQYMNPADKGTNKSRKSFRCDAVPTIFALPPDLKRKMGGHYCAALNCTASREKGVLFATFPAGERNLDRCKTWIRNMERARLVPEVEYSKMTEEEKNGLTSTKNLLLCEKHFDAEQFNIPKWKGMFHVHKTLRKDAVPTIFDLPRLGSKRHMKIYDPLISCAKPPGPSKPPDNNTTTQCGQPSAPPPTWIHEISNQTPTSTSLQPLQNVTSSPDVKYYVIKTDVPGSEIRKVWDVVGRLNPKCLSDRTNFLEDEACGRDLHLGIKLEAVNDDMTEEGNLVIPVEVDAKLFDDMAVDGITSGARCEPGISKVAPGINEDLNHVYDIEVENMSPEKQLETKSYSDVFPLCKIANIYSEKMKIIERTTPCDTGVGDTIEVGFHDDSEPKYQPRNLPSTPEPSLDGQNLHCENEEVENDEKILALRDHDYFKEERKKIHVIRGSESVQHNCDYCQEFFESEALLQNHGAMTSDCSLCFLKFPCAMLMQKHLIEVHSIEMYEDSCCHSSTDPSRNYQCSFCGLVFGTTDSLLKHIPNSSQCSACFTNFGCSRALQEHFVKAHLKSAEKRKLTLDFLCRECGVEFATVKEYIRHKDSKKTCPFCRLTFRNVDYQNHAPSDASKLDCLMCNEKFGCSQLRENHEYLVHSKIAPESRALQTKKQKVKPRSEKKGKKEIHSQRGPFSCKICDKQFKSTLLLAMHERYKIHEPAFCEICSKAFKTRAVLRTHNSTVHRNERSHLCEICGMGFKLTSRLTAHKRVVHCEEEPYVCDHCGRRFRSQATMKIHIRIHTGEKPYQCSICGKKFRQSPHLRRHELSHAGTKAHKCQLCDSSFLVGYELNSHVRMVHQNENSNKPARKFKKGLKCDMCEKTFSSYTARRIHFRTHTGDKPFVCGVCGKGFVAHSHLKQHKTIHTGEKPYVCDVCGKRFRLPMERTTHKRIHTGAKPYQCQLCNAKFRQNSHLAYHISTIHKRKRNHACEVCGAKFSTASNLRQHELTHSSEKPHVCETCGSKFVSARYLVRHRKAHSHQPEPLADEHLENTNDPAAINSTVAASTNEICMTADEADRLLTDSTDLP